MSENLIDNSERNLQQNKQNELNINEQQDSQGILTSKEQKKRRLKLTSDVFVQKLEFTPEILNVDYQQNIQEEHIQDSTIKKKRKKKNKQKTENDQIEMSQQSVKFGQVQVFDTTQRTPIEEKSNLNKQQQEKIEQKIEGVNQNIQKIQCNKEVQQSEINKKNQSILNDKSNINIKTKKQPLGVQYEVKRDNSQQNKNNIVQENKVTSTQDKNLQNLQNISQVKIGEEKKNILINKESSHNKESQNNKNEVITEKQKQKKQGYYSKINYNLSEIIQKQIIPIKIEDRKNHDQGKQDQQIQNSVAEQLLGQKPKKQKSKKQEQKQQQSNLIDANEQNKREQNKMNNASLKLKQNKQSENLIQTNEENIKLENDIKNIKDQLKKIKQQHNNTSSWDDAVILTEKELKELQKKENLLQQKLNDLEFKKDQISLEEQNRKKRILQEQQERKKQRFLRKLKRLGHLRNISKEIALFKKANSIPHPRSNKTTKYKAVPANQLDFELIEKKKKKVSKIKTALTLYKEQQKSIKEQQNTKSKSVKQKNESDYFETVNEDSDEKDEESKVDDLKNKTNKEDKNKLKFIEDELDEQENQKNDQKPTAQNNVIYKLPKHVNEEHNLEGVKYNNMFLRAWVDHIPDKEIDDKVLQLINELAYKQAMKKLNEPKKFRKRIVAGFKEVLNTLTTNVKDKKSKCIIVALNLEKNPLDNGSDQLILQIINIAVEKKIPIIYSSSRSRLGKAYTGKFGPRIGVLSIINYEGQFDQVNLLAQIVQQKKSQYIQQFQQNTAEQ